MNFKLAATCLAITGALLVPLAAPAAETGIDTQRVRATAYVKESVITSRVKTRLAREKPSSLARIQVVTRRGGAVVLSGRARTEADAETAVSIAGETAGVTSVSNRIRVKPRQPDTINHTKE